jgi:ELWxxDGT repeat protein
LGVLAEDGAASRAATLTMVREIGPGAASGVPSLSGSAEFKGQLFFFGNDGTNGLELWTSDGTGPGTNMLKDINTTPGAGCGGSWMQVINDVLYFSANNGVNGQELWTSDGTAAGTTMLKDINPNAASSNPSIRCVVGTTIYFTATDATYGTELWKTDGTAAGTVLVKDINPNAASSNPNSFVSYFNGTTSTYDFNGSVLFWANDGTNGTELWKTDGTAAGTIPLANISPGAGNSWLMGSAYLYNGRLLFIPVNLTGFTYSLWTTDGTASGTTLLKQFNNNFATFASIPQVLPDGGWVYSPLFNNQIFLTGDDGTAGTELWKTDGTATGTVLVKDINPGLPGSFPGSYFFNLGGRLIFPATEATTGNEWWVTDGTGPGTSLLKDINPTANTGSNPWPLGIKKSPYDRTSVPGGYVYGGSVFFEADDGTNGSELWKTDGTAAGTILLQDINPAAGIGSNPGFGGSLFLTNGTLVFPATGADGRELWSTNGTTASKVMDINSGGGDSNPSNFFFGGNTLFFNADNGVNGNELWRTDGTATGTVLVKDMNTTAAPNNASNPQVMLSTDRPVLQAGLTGFGSGRELWGTDGTDAGTLQLADVEPGTGSPMFNGNKKAGARMFLLINNLASGSELYVINLADIANPPQIVSGLNMGGAVGTPFTYQAEVLSALSPVTLTATGLPPGLTFDQKTWIISGTPTASGSYSVILVADNGAGTDTKTLKITVPGGGVSATDIDTDEDGFPDELEIELGFDPKDPNSGPFGGSKAGAPQPFTVDKLGIRLNFAKAKNDQIAFTGTIPVGVDVKYTDQAFIIDVGGVVKSFKLDVKGKSPKGNDTVAVGKAGKSGSARYTVKLNKGDFAKKLEDEGLTNDTMKAQTKTVPVIVLFMSKLYSKAQPQLYTATKNKSGKTAQPRK